MHSAPLLESGVAFWWNLCVWCPRSNDHHPQYVWLGLSILLLYRIYYVWFVVDCLVRWDATHGTPNENGNRQSVSAPFTVHIHSYNCGCDNAKCFRTLFGCYAFVHVPVYLHFSLTWYNKHGISFKLHIRYRFYLCLLHRVRSPPPPPHSFFVFLFLFLLCLANCC